MKARTKRAQTKQAKRQAAPLPSDVETLCSILAGIITRIASTTAKK